MAHRFHLPTIALSKRETEIEDLMLQGVEIREIAARLGISYRTVDAHRYKLYQNRNVHNRAGLYQAAIFRGEEWRFVEARERQQELNNQPPTLLGLS